MSTISISPRVEDLSKEYVLVPAWKKAHDYIRRHNWYADVLELDLVNADLHSNISDIAGKLSSKMFLKPAPLRLVLAPKTQTWQINRNKWGPKGGQTAAEKRLRPLAYIPAHDQTIATAFMMLVADYAETRQGDPRESPLEANKKRIVSYGNRLFCDNKKDELTFRWGNAGVYRQYFQDFRNFVARPQIIVDENFSQKQDHWAIISADLSHFFDRVRPELLHSKLEGLLGEDAEPEFLARFRAFFNWRWHEDDLDNAKQYATNASPKIKGFTRIGLPQGLVAGGFFSNVVLLDFDDIVSDSFGDEDPVNDWTILDYCRYVDDMRFVVKLGSRYREIKRPEDLERLVAEAFSKWLQSVLDEEAPGMVVNPDKCEVVLGRNQASGQIQLSSTMKRINHNASGVMDLFVGEETLELIENLLYSSESSSAVFAERFPDSVLAAKPDVKEESIARFAAHRFRQAFRTLRPMCDSYDRELNVEEVGEEEREEWNSGRFTLSSTLSRKLLDDKALQFSTRLIERWIRDPSNMRLLRVGLDLYPDVKMLKIVIELLSEYVLASRRGQTKYVAWYCAAELLKAGAVETGLVNDTDKIPANLRLKDYQETLACFARDLVHSRKRLPWYLIQQAYLYLACYGEYISQSTTGNSHERLQKHVRLHAVLQGDYSQIPTSEVASYVLIHSSLKGAKTVAQPFLKRFYLEPADVQKRWLQKLLSEDKTLCDQLWTKMRQNQKEVWENLFVDYGAIPGSDFPASLDKANNSSYSLLQLSRSNANPFRHEYLAICLAKKLIPLLKSSGEVVTPNRVSILANDWRQFQSIHPVNGESFDVQIAPLNATDARFRLPEWVSETESWKYQLGMLLRVMLTGQPDYTQDARKFSKHTTIRYNPFRSNWLRRRYGMFNGRNAFGPPWIPISSWFGSLLNCLLKWPGFPDFQIEPTIPTKFDSKKLIRVLANRAKVLQRLYGYSSKTPFLPITVPKSFGLPSPRSSFKDSTLKKMRVGVAQTVIPRFADFETHGPKLDDPDFRGKHRRHTASVLAGIQRMLEVRTTHEDDSGQGIEMLVLPELSVHEDDVWSLLRPFARQNRCIVCAGLVFHENQDVQPKLFNSAVWLIPIRQPNGSISIETVYQGKKYLTNPEKQLAIRSFRPSQWILQLVNPRRRNQKLWSMSCSVCFDATDLSLATDLKDKTDLFVIPALNRDIGTYDNLAAALHYHMFQHLVVANSGEYGGSTAQAPFSDKHRRTIFHTHGNNQVSISFFEIDFNLYRTKNGLKNPPANFEGRN